MLQQGAGDMTGPNAVPAANTDAQMPTPQNVPAGWGYKPRISARSDGARWRRDAEKCARGDQ